MPPFEAVPKTRIFVPFWNKYVITVNLHEIRRHPLLYYGFRDLNSVYGGGHYPSGIAGTLSAGVEAFQRAAAPAAYETAVSCKSYRR